MAAAARGMLAGHYPRYPVKVEAAQTQKRRSGRERLHPIVLFDVEALTSHQLPQSEEGSSTGSIKG